MSLLVTANSNVLEIAMECPRIDDEHNLIMRYASKLADYENSGRKNMDTENSVGDGNFSGLTLDHQIHQELIDELEASNRQIMEEINQLRQFKESTHPNSMLVYELQLLRQHKGELENRMSKLQDGRRDLIDQLERLMTMLKARDQKMPSSLPNNQRVSTSSRTSLSPPLIHNSTNDAKFQMDLSPQTSNSSSSSSPILLSSRTKKQFNELFLAADTINEAISQLVGHVTSDNDGTFDDELHQTYDGPDDPYRTFDD